MLSITKASLGRALPRACHKDNPGSKWLSYHSGLLAGANVIIVADRDEVGETYAKYVAAELWEVADSIKVVQSKTVGEKDDAFDHFASGATIDQFVERNDLLPARQETIIFLNKVNVRETEFLWDPYLPAHRATLFDAAGGVGKSSAIFSLISMLSVGLTPDGKKCRPQRCLILGSEDEPEDTILPRIMQFGGDPSMIAHDGDPQVLDEAGLARLSKRVRRHKFDFILIDPLFDYIGEINPNAARESVDFMKRINDFYMTMRVTGVHIRHWVRPTKDRSSADMGMGSVMWRNKHRSQLTMTRHKERDNLRVIVHDKFNLSPKGRNFGFTWEKDHFEWVWNDPMLENKGELKELMTAHAEDFLAGILRVSDTCPVNQIMKDGLARQISWRAMQKARIVLGLESFELNGAPVWGFSDYNPFSEPD